MDLGEVYYLMGKYNEAYDTIQKALTLYDKVLLQPDHYAIFNLLSNITFDLGNCSESHEMNRRFLQAQKEIQQVKEEYSMEMLTAEFFLEVEASKTKEQYQMMLGIFAFLVIFVTSLFGYEKLKQYNTRRSLKKAILDIDREFDV